MLEHRTLQNPWTLKNVLLPLGWSGDAPPQLSSAAHVVYVREGRVLGSRLSGGRKWGRCVFCKLAEARRVRTCRSREVALDVARTGSVFTVRLGSSRLW